MRLHRKLHRFILVILPAIMLICIFTMVSAPSIVRWAKPFYHSPSWFPGGRDILYVCYDPTIIEALIVLFGAGHFFWTNGENPYSPMSAELCTVTSDGTERRQVTHNREAAYSPVWSADGSQIAYISRSSQGRGISIINRVGNTKSDFFPVDDVSDF